jgi:hypothetical protein
MKFFLLLIIPSLLFSSDYKNPNGKPFTLTVGYDTYYGDFSFKLPLSNYITISGYRVYRNNPYYLSSDYVGQAVNLSSEVEAHLHCPEYDENFNELECQNFEDYYDVNSSTYDADFEFHMDDWISSSYPIYDYKLSKFSIQDFANYKIEVHIPIYKIWEK